MQDDGGGGGISGTLDLPGAGVKFSGWWRAFDADISSSLVDDAGRGDSEWTPKLPTSSNGFITISGTAVLDGYPLPTKYRGELGTIKHVHCAAVDANPEVSQTYAVRVRHSEFGKPDKASGEMAFTHICQIVAEPTLAGYGGTQTASTDENLADKILWAALSTLTDPNGIQGSATRRLRMWGIGENDAAEKAKADTVLAAIAIPYTGLKVRTGNFTRVSKNLAYIDATFGLTDTKDDLENEGSGVLDDPTDLEDGTEIALVQSSTTPSAPGTPSGLKIITTATKKLNDNRWLHTFRYGRRDNKDAIEQEGTYTDTDVSDITSEGRQTTVYTTAGGVPADPTPPSGLQIVSSRITVRNNVKSVKTWIFAKDTPAQKAVQERSFTYTDPSGIDTEAAAAAIGSTPSTPAGTVEVGTKVENLTHDHSITTVKGGMLTPADRLIFPHIRTETDVSGLRQENSFAKQFTTGSAPSAPSPPAGMVITDFFDAPLTNATATNQSIRVYRLSFVTNTQRLTLPHYSNYTDPEGLESRKRSAVIWDSADIAPADPSLPSGLKVVGKEDVAIESHPTQQARIYQWGPQTSRDKIQQGGSNVRVNVFEDTKYQTTTVLDTTDPITVTAAAYRLANKSNAHFNDAIVEKLDDNHTRVTLLTQDNEVVVTFSMESYGDRRTLTRVIGGEIYVYLREVIQSGSNLWQYQLAEQPVRAARMTFTVDRRVSGTEIPLHEDLLQPRATTNAAAFLGLPSNFVSYLGIDGVANISIAPPRVSRVRFKFLYDSLGFVELEDTSSGWKATATTLRTVDAGTWILASSIGLAPVTLDTGDYSGFLT